MDKLVIDDALLERLGIKNKETNPVPFTAFDFIDFGAHSATIQPSYNIFFFPDRKDSIYRSFAFEQNVEAMVITHICFTHNLHFTPPASGTTDQPILQSAWEQQSYIKFGLNNKPIFQFPICDVVPWVRGANALTMSLLEKEAYYERLLYPIEITERMVGSCQLICPNGYVSGAGGSSDADMSYLPNYPTNVSGASGNNASNNHFFGKFSFRGVRFVTR